MSKTFLSPADDATYGNESFLADVIEGLGRPRKSLPPKYFYDEQGSRLFEQITRLPEYYLSRTETSILSQHADDIAELCRDRAALIEFGSGSFHKASLILRACPWMSVYAPCDISGEFLTSQRKEIGRSHGRLNVLPIIADFTQPFRLPMSLRSLRGIGAFLGSTIGNFGPGEACGLLANFASILRPFPLLLIGVDLVKDAATLTRAYDDLQGVTAQFNLNLLARMNRELDAEFDLGRFEHRAFFNQARSRVEMHLVSCCDQEIRVADRVISFGAGETIHTENSYKYTLSSFASLAHAAGWRVSRRWTDAECMFSVHALSMQ